MKPPASRLWIALTRPDNLVNAAAIALAGRGRFSECQLLYENSPWWTTVDWQACPAVFDEVRAVEKVKTCRGVRDVSRFYRALSKRQRALAELRIAPDDLIVTLAGITTLSTALASAYPQVRKILCTAIKKYRDASRPVSWIRYRHTTSGWLQHYLLEPRLGLRPTLRLKKRWAGGDGVRLERPREALEEMFDAVVVLSNDGADRPPAKRANVHSSPFPSLDDLKGWMPDSGEAVPGREIVVFFGSPFLLVCNLPPAVYRERLNACLDYLRRCYGSTHGLVYRPHPAETGERQQLDLQGFTVEEDGQVAELYFLRNFRRIGAVFSVSSTVSRVALNYGLDSYTLWHCFPFNEVARHYFGSVMGRVPEEFDIRSLDQPPTEYASRRRADEKAGSFLDVMDGLFG